MEQAAGLRPEAGQEIAAPGIDARCKPDTPHPATLRCLSTTNRKFYSKLQERSGKFASAMRGAKAGIKKM
jgi:hypothetical protein